jgi:hypothetical protein
MTTWTPEAVLALAPDAGVAKSAQGLGSAGRWQGLGRHEAALWGEIKGSGASPYQARIDLREPAFKCTCPSRKFPCKHGLALLLVYAREAKSFAPREPPPWVADWLATRDQRSEKKVEKAAAAQVAEPRAQERRAEKREARVEAGLEQLQVWLRDLMRLGLGHAQLQPRSLWESMSAQLVDAQAPGLARMVRKLEEATQTGTGWQGRLMHGIARVELIRAAYASRAALPLPLAEEARTAIGWTQSAEELASEPAVRDQWLVVGIAAESEERLKVRRTWLWGRETRRAALLLDFAAGAQAGAQAMDAALPVGCVFDGELAFHRGAAGLRAMVRSRGAAPAEFRDRLPGHENAELALASYAEALGRVPWLERFPMGLNGVRVGVRVEEGAAPSAWLRDRNGARVALPPRFPHAWHLVALSGGEPIDVFGEWDGEYLRPLTVAASTSLHALGEKLVALRRREAA